MKLMFMKYAEKMRGGRVDFTSEELETAMIGTCQGQYTVCLIIFIVGQMPGIPKMCVISFHGSFHGQENNLTIQDTKIMILHLIGRTIGCLSVTHSKPIHLVDIPLMGW